MLNCRALRSIRLLLNKFRLGNPKTAALVVVDLSADTVVVKTMLT